MFRHPLSHCVASSDTIFIVLLLCHFKNTYEWIPPPTYALWVIGAGPGRGRGSAASGRWNYALIWLTRESNTRSLHTYPTVKCGDNMAVSTYSLHQRLRMQATRSRRSKDMCHVGSAPTSHCSAPAGREQCSPTNGSYRQLEKPRSLHLERGAERQRASERVRCLARLAD